MTGGLANQRDVTTSNISNWCSANGLQWLSDPASQNSETEEVQDDEAATLPHFGGNRSACEDLLPTRIDISTKLESHSVSHTNCI
jgi:hypothetical protein